MDKSIPDKQGNLLSLHWLAFTVLEDAVQVARQQDSNGLTQHWPLHAAVQSGMTVSPVQPWHNFYGVTSF